MTVEMTPSWYVPPFTTRTTTYPNSAGWIALKATLIQESLDAIRQIIREELHETLLSSGIPSSEETPEQEAREEAEDKKFEEVMREAFGNPSLRVEKPEDKKVESPKEHTLEEKAQWINTWLRYHTDYDVSLHFNVMYSLLEMSVSKKTWVNHKIEYENLYNSHGATLSKRFDQVIAYLQSINEEKPEEKD